MSGVRTVFCSMGITLDGYHVGPDGGFDWGAPDEELFRWVLEDFRGVGAHLLGRRVYETMLYWDGREQDPTLGADQREWAALWAALPKTVFSRTLTEVRGRNTRLAAGGLAEEIARLQDGPGDGDIAVGGPVLAAEAAALGLLDEYRVRVHPVLVGGGRPLFPQQEQQVGLELVDSRVFPGCGVVSSRYRVVR